MDIQKKIVYLINTPRGYKEFVMAGPFHKIKKSWDDYLVRLAQVNKDLYGGKRLDCCDLNNEQKLHSSTKKER